MKLTTHTSAGFSKLFLACALSVPLVSVTACGGGGESSTSKVRQFVGKVYAKVLGDKIGEIKAQIKQITDTVGEIEGTIEVDGVSYDFAAPVSENGQFHATFTGLVAGTNTIAARGEMDGQLVLNSAGAAEPVSVTGGWSSRLPKAPGESEGTTVFTGTLSQSHSAESGAPATSGGTTTGNLPAASSCEWSASAFYNPGETVTYQGTGYTAKTAVVPFGPAGAVLFNPASNSTNWNSGGTCGPVPFIEVSTADCTKGASADTIVMTGTAYGGGVGDAIAAYTNVTDRSFSNENNFGLPGTQYQMTCEGGGFVANFTSSSSPTYSVCVKTQASGNRTNWTSTQVVPHSTTLVPFSTAYASKGNPLRATVFSPGAIVIGFDEARSVGLPITGNCN